MKTALAVLIALCLLPIGSAEALSASVGDVSVDAYIKDDSIWVPLRALSVALGAEAVNWENDTKTVTVIADDLVICVSCGNEYIVANDRYLFVDGGCELRNERLYAPLDTLALAFGADTYVDWDNETVYITPGTPILRGEYYYDDTDLYWLSRIIYAEANGETLRGKTAVGNVVMNRVASSEFPWTVEDVIFDRKYGVQFTPAYSGGIYNTPDESCVIAAKLALDGADVAGSALYFASVATARYSWAAKHCSFVAQIDHQLFYA